MKPVYYLAVDIGASSGRHILASMDNGRMTIEEVYRFDNGMINDNGNKLWDVDSLFANIIEGMKKCKELGKIPVSMSIDTWAVDYVLLDDNDKCIGNVYGYRDERTDGMDEEVYKVISEKELYKRTGIQKQKFNTIYQLMSDKFIRPEQLKEAKTFIMLPDYFQFLLTGVKASEYTNATSTQLVNPETKQWDYELIDMLGINRNMFMEQANKPLTMKTITVRIESSNEPYEKGSDFDISQYKEELYSFQWQGDSIAPVNSVEEAAKAAEQLWNVVFDYDIETKRPFIVSYDETNKIWLIKGSMRELRGGGVPYALITIDGKVLAIWHTR